MIGTIHIVVAMKPLEGNFAENALKHGVAGLNVDGCRVGGERHLSHRGGSTFTGKGYIQQGREYTSQGRWPANVIHDGSVGVVEKFPQSEVSGAAKTGGVNPNGKDYSDLNHVFGGRIGKRTGMLHNDSGSAARFFYCIGEFEG